MNTVTFIGNAGSEPKIIELPSGDFMARFNLATSERFINKKGEEQIDTQWHPIVAWGKTAQAVKDFVHKGSCVGIKAKAVNNHYDKEIEIETEVTISKNKKEKQMVKTTIKVFATEYQAFNVNVYK